MADPVYLEQGISQNPAIDVTPDLGAQESSGSTFTAALDEAVHTGPLAYASGLLGNFSQPITGAEATAKYGVQGPTPELSLSWKPDEMVPEDQAQQAQIMMRHKIQDDFVMANRPKTWTGWGASGAGDLSGTAADPLNIAATLVPVTAIPRAAELAFGAAGLTRAAEVSAGLSRALESTIAGRMTGAALNNAAGVALTQPIILAGAQQMHQDYTFGEAASNVLMGGVLGAGLHGLGEVAGATWRSMMRGGVSSLETGDLSGAMNADMLAADRSQVVKDLTEQNGVEPTEEAIQSEVQARQQQFVDNVKSGKYFSALPDQEGTSSDLAVPDHVVDLAANGQYAEASEAMKSHVDSLESDPNLNLSDDEKKEANQPVSTFEKIKGAIADFTNCIAAETA